MTWTEKEIKDALVFASVYLAEKAAMAQALGQKGGQATSKRYGNFNQNQFQKTANVLADLTTEYVFSGKVSL